MRNRTYGLFMGFLVLAGCVSNSGTPTATSKISTAAPAATDTFTPEAVPTATNPPVVSVLPPDAGTGKTLTLNVSLPGQAISPNLYGIFFEEDNYAGDGGLYAELVRNRSFNEDDNATPASWSLVTGNGSSGNMALDFGQPLNALNRSLKLKIDHIGAGGRVGISNSGYWGIKLINGTSYSASIYAKAAAGFSGPLTISLENQSGVVLAQETVSGITTEWQKYTRTLTVNNPGGTTADNQLVVSAATPGTVWLQAVSLFPPTWKNRPNGLRSDIMQMLAAMHPKMCRFPGGTSTEGITFKDHYQWKQTIGDLTQRPGHMGAFGYYVSDGLGFHELLQMCEDLGGTSVLDAFGGYSHNTDVVVPQGDMQEYVTDALDAIEYANGDVTTTWGAKRAANGHPAPFHLKYIEVSNEDWLTDAGWKSYREYRFQMFYDQIKAKYPQIQVISTMDVSPLRADLQDSHINDLRNGLTDISHGANPKIFVGEWFQVDWNNLPKQEEPPPNLDRAIFEAIFMTRFEQYSDSIWSSSYAPLLVNDNDRHFNWGPIYYDAMQTFGTPTYYAQQMFANHVGDVTVPTLLTGGDGNLYYAASRATGDNTIYLKVVNNANNAQVVTIQLNGVGSVDPAGMATVLTSGSRTDGNTMENQTKVIPTYYALSGVGPSFAYSFPPNSVTVITLKEAGFSRSSNSTPISQPTGAPSQSNPTAAPAIQPTPTLGSLVQAVLKGYWKFDEGSDSAAADSSNNGNDGTLQAGAGWAAGKIGVHAVNLSGATDSFVTIPKAVVNTQENFSVAAWVKLNAFDNFQTAVSMDGVNCSPFYLQWRVDTRKFALTATMEDAKDPGSAFTSARTVPVLGTWYHIAGVFDGTSIKLYVNGILEGTSAFTKIWTAKGLTVIGRAKYNGNEVDFFHGQIDEVRLYQGVLTDQEVAALAGGQ